MVETMAKAHQSDGKLVYALGWMKGEVGIAEHPLINSGVAQILVTHDTLAMSATTCLSLDSGTHR